MGATAPRRLLPAFLIAFLLILTTAYYVASLRDAVPSPRDIVTTVGDKLKGVTQTPEPFHEDEPESKAGEEIPTTGGRTSPVAAQATAISDATTKEPEHDPAELDEPSLHTYHYDQEATPKSEEGVPEKGLHFHVRPSSPSIEPAIEGCEYPILIHTSPDGHCTGALALYASIVRNTLTQPSALRGKVCVHFTYVEESLKTIEEMYKWPARDNPYMTVPDCAALDSTPALNNLVPVRWQALAPIEKPEKMQAGVENWLKALNKVHSWAFDLYPRILILDADSFIITDLHSIFNETPPDVAISAPPDQFWGCHDRIRLNGGMVLLGQPGRYFHMIMAEILHDPDASCISGKWEQSEQELLNCFCGYNYADAAVIHALRPEFVCRLMPIYNSVWPKNYRCSDVNVRPMRSIHFTAVTKPWNVPEAKLDDRFDTLFYKCLRDHARGNDAQGLKTCTIPELEETRKLGDDIPAPEKETRDSLFGY